MNEQDSAKPQDGTGVTTQQTNKRQRAHARHKVPTEASPSHLSNGSAKPSERVSTRISEGSTGDLPLGRDGVEIRSQLEEHTVLPNAADADHVETGQDPAAGHVPATSEQDSQSEEKQQQVQRQLLEAFAAEIESNGKHNVPYEVLGVPNVEADCWETEHPYVAFKAHSDPDTLYLHEAMKQTDQKEFW